MKALFIPSGESFSIELIPESPEETADLVMYWEHESFSISCEEWRELTARTS